MRFRVYWRRLRDYLWVIRHHYANRRYRWADLRLRLLYLGRGPYAISKAHCVKRGEYNPYQYGETPLRTLADLAARFGITASDTVYELGCGPGYTALWLHSVCGCRVVGIDWVPTFVRRAQKAARKLPLDFCCQDITEVDYQKATVVYLYGTCLEDKTIEKLLVAFRSLPQGARVITVSYPLTEYEGDFRLLDRVQAHYTWGRADVYLQQKVN